MSYKNLEIWKLSRELVIQVHLMSLKLPKMEQFEEGRKLGVRLKRLKPRLQKGMGEENTRQILLNF